MTHADIDQLAELAIDPDDSPADVRRHVAACADCTHLLASLSDVRRLAGAEPLVPPPARVREQVLAHVRQAAAADPPEDRVTGPVGLPGPGPSRPTRLPARRAVPTWAAGLAAGVALVAGLGLGRITGGTEVPEAVAPSPSEGAVVAAADLRALDSERARGVASVVRAEDTITLRVEASSLGEDEGFHEVWLINVDGTRMVALGVLASGDTGEFQVPTGLIEEGYRIVDISVEPEDGDPTHSGVSLARGELA